MTKSLVEDQAFIHETVLIENEVEVGSGTKIWHYSHLLPGSKVGSGCVIGRNVSIGPKVSIGNNVKIQNNVSVYSGVIIEDDVFCGPSCVFTNVLNPRAFVNRKNEFEATYLRKGCSIGANATIVCGNSIGKYALVAAGATVTKSVPDFGLVAGTPARLIGWVSKLGHTLGQDFVCPESGQKYYLKSDNQLAVLDDE